MQLIYLIRTPPTPHAAKLERVFLINVTLPHLDKYNRFQPIFSTTPSQKDLAL